MSIVFTFGIEKSLTEWLCEISTYFLSQFYSWKRKSIPEKETAWQAHRKENWPISMKNGLKVMRKCMLHWFFFFISSACRIAHINRSYKIIILAAKIKIDDFSAKIVYEIQCDNHKIIIIKIHILSRNLSQCLFIVI